MFVVRKALRRAFTLIELLIVIAIVAILAAIAVPNFLSAQTRAKVSRVKADLRTIATALEAYAVDENGYPPNDGNFNVIPIQVSTPIAYLTNTKLVDPFTDKERDPVFGELIRFYSYHLMVDFDDLAPHVIAENTPPVEAVDGTGFNEGARARYGSWKTFSLGPDRTFTDSTLPAGPFNPAPNVLAGQDIPYDPTNGTVSFGNVLRTQRGEGVEAAP